MPVKITFLTVNSCFRLWVHSEAIDTYRENNKRKGRGTFVLEPYQLVSPQGVLTETIIMESIACEGVLGKDILEQLITEDVETIAESFQKTFNDCVANVKKPNVLVAGITGTCDNFSCAN